MIIHTPGKSFEANRSVNQELTFATMQKQMQKRNLAFTATEMEALKMIGSDTLYSNLAFLLSDQCTYTMKVAVFEGRETPRIVERKEFKGSILKQYNDMISFLDVEIKKKISDTKSMKAATPQYPDEAIAEVLLNSIIHRDYMFSASNLINLYEDRLECISLGGLAPGMSMEAINMGACQSRNPGLAAVFTRMDLAQNFGTGIRRIKELYSHCYLDPIFRAAEGAFSVILPNIHESLEVLTDTKPTTKISTPLSIAEKEKIYQIAKEQGSVTRNGVEKLLGLKTTKAFRLIKEMCESGVLEQEVNGKYTRYIPK